MDEPLSNLDAKLRVHMRFELNKIHRELEATIIYVTHDQIEALTLGDRLVLMKDGIVQQIGLGVALEYLMDLGMDNVAAHERLLRDYARDRLDGLNWLNVQGKSADKAAIFSFTLEGAAHAHDISTVLDKKGVAVRAGQLFADHTWEAQAGEPFFTVRLNRAVSAATRPMTSSVTGWPAPTIDSTCHRPNSSMTAMRSATGLASTAACQAGFRDCARKAW